MNKTTRKTIVIGAGMAGIAAARTLHDAGYSVKILEARERIGGRTHTDRSLGPTIDLGASWIHGHIGNPLTPLAKQAGVEMKYTDFINQWGTSIMAFDADGNPLEINEYTEGLQAFAGAETHLFGSILHRVPDTNVRSVADLYRHGLPGTESMTPTQQKGFYYTSVICAQYSDAADIDEIDWWLSDAYVSLPGGDMLLYGGGYNAITDHLAEGLEIENGVIVEEIAHSDDGATLTLNRSDGQSQESCDCVIVTVPLGVLKADSIRFTPELPREKQEAIRRIGMGNYEKLALRFPRCFWPTEPQRFHYLTDQSPELWTSWLNNAHFTGEPILVAYHSGSRAQAINLLSDDALIEEALAVLSRIFGPTLNEAEIPAPTSYLRTGWENDPFAQGSYSFSKVSGRPDDRGILAQPVGGRLFFAGEATHPHYFATVHGAYETGIRAAHEVQNR